MPTKYIWWDQKRKDPPKRLEIRPPASLHGFVEQIADRNGVSVNAFVVALLQWAVTADEASKLCIEIGPSKVELTAKAPAHLPAQVPVQNPTPDRRFPYGKPKAR